MYGDLILQGLAFFQLAKAYTDPKHVEKDNVDPKIKFLRECYNNNVLAVPMLHKITNSCLLLRNNKINSGQAQGLFGNFMMTNDLL